MADVEGRGKGCCGFEEEMLTEGASTGEGFISLWLLLIVLSPAIPAAYIAYTQIECLQYHRHAVAGTTGDAVVH